MNYVVASNISIYHNNIDRKKKQVPEDFILHDFYKSQNKVNLKRS